MKSVLISIQPKWCELIASGKKTVEVRKTKPKLETPFKCYIYCTKGETIYLPRDIFGKEALNGKVIGEFVCDKVLKIYAHSMGYGVEVVHPFSDTFTKDTCLTIEQLSDYLKCNDGYGWHISNLVIYDKPRELSEFYTIDNEAVQKCEYRFQTYYNFTDTGYIKNGFACSYKDQWCDKCKTKPLTRPPQSWCYVESEDTE